MINNVRMCMHFDVDLKLFYSSALLSTVSLI